MVYRVRNKKGKYFSYIKCNINDLHRWEGEGVKGIVFDWFDVEDAYLFTNRGTAIDEAIDCDAAIEKCVVAYVEDVDLGGYL
jgi:hypothetical protein